MDYIFDEDIFEVGAEVDAYCTRCKIDTPHTVLTKYEDEIRSVQCTTCSATHAYRPPRGDVEEEIPEPIAARRRQAMQKRPWEEAIAELSDHQATPYSPKERYSEGQVVEHPRFGVGYVSELLSDTKMEAIFADGRRILVHNRGDLDIVIAPPRKGARPVMEALRKQKPALAEALRRQKAGPGGKGQTSKGGADIDGKDNTARTSTGQSRPASSSLHPTAAAERAETAGDADPGGQSTTTRPEKAGGPKTGRPSAPRKEASEAPKAARPRPKPKPKQPPKPARKPEKAAARPVSKKPAGKARRKPAGKAAPRAASSRGKQGGKAAGKRSDGGRSSSRTGPALASPQATRARRAR